MLPAVSFGGLFDQAHELLVQLGAPDVRSWATEFVGGDIGKALSQASAWEHAGRALTAVSGNLSHGSQRVARTWEGSAAQSSRTYSRDWIGALDLQGDTLARVAAHLRDAVEQAVDVAQLVVDTVKEMLAIVLAGYVLRLHPDLRPGRARQAAPRHGAGCSGTPKKVLAVFWYFLLVIKDCFIGAADALTGEPLPPAPALPARAA